MPNDTARQPADEAGAIPAALQEPFKVLANDVQIVHWRWHAFLDLFADTETVGLLDHHAGVVFGLIQGALYNDVCLMITRLLDRGKANLTLESLLHKIADPALAEELRVKLADVRTSSTSIRKHRDKKVAHRDSLTALTAWDYQAASHGEIDKALEDVRSFMNAIELHYQGSTEFYDFRHDNVSYLMDSLRRADKHREAENG